MYREINGDNWADYSSCRRYRYGLSWLLDRNLPRRAVFLMLNPSTADAFKLDRTITRCSNFALRESCGTIMILNLFGFRSTNPDGLKTCEDAIGSDNDAYLSKVLQEVVENDDLLICGWGIHGNLLGRNDEVLQLIQQTNVETHTLKLTKHGHPGHPLYLRHDAPLIQVQIDERLKFVTVD